MAAAVISTAASRVLSKRFLSSASHLPQFLMRRRPTILLAHSLALLSPASPCSSRFTPIRWYTSPSDYGCRGPPGLDEETWAVLMDKPGGEELTQQQILDFCSQALAEVVGSEEEAKKKIYEVVCGEEFRIGCVIDEETSNKLRGLSGVKLVYPDKYAPSYQDRADELKLDALYVKRAVRYIENKRKGEGEGEGEYKFRYGKWCTTLEWHMERIEEDIQLLPVGFRPLAERCESRGEMLLKMGHVLNDLSVHVKQLWNINAKGGGDDSFNSPIPTNTERMKQVKKAIESLLLAAEALDLLAHVDQGLIAAMEPIVSEFLYEDVMELCELWEKDRASAYKTYLYTDDGPLFASDSPQ